MGFDLSRVPHMEVRKALLAYDEANEAAHNEEIAATEALRDKIDKAREAVRLKSRDLEKDLVEPLKAELEKLEEPFTKRREENGTKLEAAIEAAGLEWEDIHWHDDYTGIYHCDATGLPLLRSDPLLANEEGQEFLSCVLLPDPPTNR